MPETEEEKKARELQEDKNWEELERQREERQKVERERQTEALIPGAGLARPEPLPDYLQNVVAMTDKMNNISDGIIQGLTYLYLGRDILQAIKNLANMSEDEIRKAKQKLWRQAKSEAWRIIKSHIPTRQEIFDYLMGFACDLVVIEAVKKVKDMLLDGLNYGKNIADDVVNKLNKVKEAIQKAADFLGIIAVILIIFQSLMIAFEILVIVSKLALNFFTSLFAAAGAEYIIHKAIAFAEKYILMGTAAVKGFTSKALKMLGKIFVIFNIIPRIIAIFVKILGLINMYITLIETLWEQYIRQCIPAGDLYITNEDGTVTVNDKALIDYITSINNGNTNTNNGNNLGTSSPDIYDNYIYDDSEKQHRIYKPKRN